jgi:hypothetical protein
MQVSRGEVEDIAATVRTRVLEVAATNPRYFSGFAPAEWRVVAAGGYRRGKAEFHDADFLVTHSRLGLDMLHKGAHDGGESLLELLVPSPRHSCHDENPGLTEIYLPTVPILILLMTRSR